MVRFNKFLIFIFIEIFQIKSKLHEEKVDIAIISLELPQVSCIPNLSTFIFNIKVEFSKSPLIKNILTIDLLSNIKAFCYPFEKTNVTISFFQCKINTVDYPIKNKILFLPLEPPISNYYNFLNWKEKIGENPEISNRITEKEIDCLPKELNSYKINEIKSEGCSNNKNVISLKGVWINENKLVPKNFEFNLNEIKGKCNIISLNWIQCTIEGIGDIKFLDNYYFEYQINTFMIQKSEKFIHINDCNDNSTDNKTDFLRFFFFSKKIFISLILLFL